MYFRRVYIDGIFITTILHESASFAVRNTGKRIHKSRFTSSSEIAFLKGELKMRKERIKEKHHVEENIPGFRSIACDNNTERERAPAITVFFFLQLIR